MADLRDGNGNAWDLPHGQWWEDRGPMMRLEPRPLLEPNSHVFVTGACVAVGVGAWLRNVGVGASAHPDGYTHDSKTLKQAILGIYDEWPGRDAEPIWQVPEGWIDPFAASGKSVLPSEDEVRARRSLRRAKARKQLDQADVVLLSIDFIETWRNDQTGNYFITLPRPDVYSRLRPTLHRLTSEEIKQDLREIVEVLRRHGKQKVVLMPSGAMVDLTATARDVRQVAHDTIARIYVAMSELCEADPGLTLFPVSAFIHMSERARAFRGKDDRHLHNKAIELLASQFVDAFGAGMTHKPVDASWLTSAPEAGVTPGVAAPPPPHETDAPPDAGAVLRRQLGRLRRRIEDRIPMSALPAPVRELIAALYRGS